MILAAGLSPAWQHIIVLDALRVGEVNRAREATACGSGKVLNVGLALHHLGGPSRTLSLLGGRAAGDIQDEFERLGVPTRWVKSQTPTRVCTTVLDRSSHRTTELVENAGPVAPAELDEFRRAFAEEAASADVVVLTGSLPAGVPRTIYADLLADVRCATVIDARGQELLAALERRPLLVKPNREELAATVQRPLDRDADLLAAMQELNGRGAEWVLVTQGGQPAWASGAGKTYRLTPPPVATIVNPIACGDCLAGGFAWAIRAGQAPLDALRFGMGAAVANLGTLLPSRLKLDEVQALADQVAVASA